MGKCIVCGDPADVRLSSVQPPGCYCNVCASAMSEAHEEDNAQPARQQRNKRWSRRDGKDSAR